MKESVMKAMAEAFANEAQEKSSSKTFIQKLSGKRIEKPVVKLFEDNVSKELSIIVIIIFTGDMAIVIVIFD